MELKLAGSALSPEDRHRARELWAAMMPATSQIQLDAARQALKAAPLTVQRAVTTAIVQLWAQGQDAEWNYNPFD